MQPSQSSAASTVAQPTPNVGKRFDYTTADDILLLKEVVAANSNPFIFRGAEWKGIAERLSQVNRLKSVSERSSRERAILLVKEHVKNDAYYRKQSGTEEEYGEKEKLLDEAKMLWETKEDCRNAAKEKERQSAALAVQLRDASLKTLAGKPATAAAAAAGGGPAPKRRRRSGDDDGIGQALMEHSENVTMAELKLKQKEQQLKERELAFKERELEMRSARDERMFQA